MRKLQTTKLTPNLIEMVIRGDVTFDELAEADQAIVAEQALAKENKKTEREKRAEEAKEKRARRLTRKEQAKKFKVMKASDTHTDRYLALARSAEERGIELKITYEEFLSVCDLPCYYCDGYLDNDKGTGYRLDRVDNAKDYHLTNVVPCCAFCNVLRGDRFSVEEAKAMLGLLVEIRFGSTIVQKKGD
jgi:hypothetical protein